MADIGYPRCDDFADRIESLTFNRNVTRGYIERQNIDKDFPHTRTCNISPVVVCCKSNFVELFNILDDPVQNDYLGFFPLLGIDGGDRMYSVRRKPACHQQRERRDAVESLLPPQDVCTR